MGFQDAKGDSTYVEIEDGRYIVKLVQLEEMPPNEAHPDWGASIRWYLNVATYPEQRVLMDPTSKLPLEFWQYTGTSMSPKSKARPWVEAFLGRALIDGQDKGDDITAAVVGCKAVALIGLNANGKKAILSIQPFAETAKKSGGKPSAAVQVLEDDLPPEQRTGAAQPEPAYAF
jgi:hypothetical protein